MKTNNFEESGGFGEIDGSSVVFSQTSANLIAQAIKDHAASCLLEKEKLSERVRSLETRFAYLVGLMAGSGVIGGLVSGSLIKLLP